MARILTVTANPLLDFVCDTELRAGAVNRVAALTAVAEGKGVNVARVLTRLGHRVACCGFAGGATGALFGRLVAEFGAEASFTDCAARLRTGFMAAPPGAAHPTTLLEGGFAVRPAEADALLATVEGQLSDCALVIISGSVPCPEVADIYPRLISACAAADRPCWVDSYGAGMRAALAGTAAPALSKPNREEYATCEGWERVAELHRTAGHEGILVDHPEGHWQVRPPAVRQVNPVGSGDCYLAGLAHARVSGLELADQLRWAAAAGAANAARPDIAAIDEAAINALLDGVVIEAR